MLFAARLLAGSVSSPVLVPEGFDDYSFEGGDEEQVQVKSRQSSKGPFSVLQVAKFVVDATRKVADRRADGLPGRAVVVIERAMPDDIPWTSETRLGDAPIDHPLREAVLGNARASGVAPGLCDEASVVVLPWSEARREASRLICARYDIPPQAADVLLRALRNEVTRSVTVNAQAPVQMRARLDRTSLARVADAARGLLKAAELEEALTAGVCEAVDVHTPLLDERFYEGVSARPGHIAAGLAVARPELQAQVARAVNEENTVLIAGPSGVGKSVLLWLSVADLGQVLWFRVRRLQEQDVPAIVRLARAHSPSPEFPVGFAVDGIGIGSIQAWDTLQEDLAGIPGARLVGTARLEDLPRIRSLAQCTVVEPALDEELAERIFSELRSTGGTNQAHWRQAFKDAGGLTLEYTHLLTRGRRLVDVIEDQVRTRRADPGRDLELRVIALASVAHQWGAELDVRNVQVALAADDGELRRALSRLIDEHLLYENGSSLAGVHQLRSAALARAVHSVPPPVLSDTIRIVLSMVDDDHLGRVLASALRDHEGLRESLLEQAQHELERRESVIAWTSLMQALRVLDFQRLASRWPDRFAAVGVPPALWSMTVQMALAGEAAFGSLREDVSAGIDAIRVDLDGRSPLRDDFVARCSAQTVARILTTNAATIQEAARALAVLQGAAALTIESWVGRLLDGSPLARLLMTSSTPELGEVLESARTVSASLPLVLFGAAGGQESVFARLHSEHAGLVSLNVVRRGNEIVAAAELTQADVDDGQEMDAYISRFAKDLLRCLPTCDATDVRGLGPGRIPINLAPNQPLVKALRRGRSYSSTQVAWNRVRIDIVSRIGDVPDPAHHAGETLAIIDDLADYLEAVVQAWCVGEATRPQANAIDEQQRALMSRVELLRTPITLALNDTSQAVDDAVLHQMSDPIYTLTQGITVNMTPRLVKHNDWGPLAGYVGQQLRSTLRDVAAEPWELVGSPEPAALANIDTVLSSLRCTLAELAAGTISRRSIAAIARGRKSGALAQVALAAIEQRDDAIRTWIESIESRARTAGYEVTVLSREHDTSELERIPIQIAVAIPVGDFSEWSRALGDLPAIVNSHPAERGTSAPVLLVPVIGGRPLRRLAMQLRQNPYPGQELFDLWADEFPPAWITPLSDALSSAYAAAFEISEVASLIARRPGHPTDQSRIQHARNDLNEAREKLTAEGSIRDEFAPIVEELEHTFVIVEAELAAQGEMDHNFSTEYTMGATGRPTETFNRYANSVLLAIATELTFLIDQSNDNA